ncbi:MAG: ribonuclease Z [Muribaculaceae bacterium]|nr:ribonuclease Z [Muribaculaceae bacterium]
MSDFKVHILGCGSATPTARHKPSCQVVNAHGKLFMIDCGEGAQLEFRRQGLKFSRLGHIFISHMHGDHFLGLPGLLSTMALHDKEGDITVHIHPEGAHLLKEIMAVLCRETPYTLHYDIIDPGSRRVLYEDRSLTVETFPLYHRVPCSGFIVREKQPRRPLLPDMLDHYAVPVAVRQAIAEGADFEASDGRIIPNSWLTREPAPPASYAYCSATRSDARVAAAIKGVRTMYHEATYDDSQAFKASARGHATAREAAIIARKAGAERLVLGHYSKSIADETLLVAEAAEEFKGEILAATEGLVFAP